MSHKHSGPKLRNLAILIGIAQLLLLIFVGPWLKGQYRDEETNLQNEISESIIYARQQVLDSMLVHDYINPILASKQGFKIHIDSSGSIPLPPDMQSKQLEFSDTFNNTNEDSIITIFSDSNGAHHKNTITFIHKIDSTKDFLLQGVKLIVKEVAKNDSAEHHIEQTIYSNADTALLKNLIREKFTKSGWKFTTLWTQQTDMDSAFKTRHGAMYFNTNLFPRTYGLSVNDYSFYIWKKISPQIFFSLILLIVSGFAFIISYRTLNKQLQLNKLRNDFIDNISHELKTPVSTVKVVVEALQNPEIRNQDQKTSEYLNMASKEINRLELLISKVLNTSLLGEELQSIERNEINLLELIQQIIDSFRFRVEESNATLQFASDGEAFTFHGDPVHLQGAFMNLIDNGLKYSGPNPFVSVMLRQTDSGFSVFITDNGPGIPDKFKEKIFDKFFRVPVEGGHLVKGHGLGLSYTAMVIHHHGGTIGFTNLKEGGVCFQITLPK